MLQLSSVDQRRLAGAVRTLLSPLDHADVDSWRRQVNRGLKDLLRADMATFLLPAEDRRLVYSEDIDVQRTHEYPHLMPRLPEPVSIWERQAELGVWTRATVYGALLRDYYKSEYYNDYVVPVRAHDSIGITVPLADPVQPTSLAGLIFHHERREGPRFGARGPALLRLVHPAFEAGARIYLQLARHRESFARTLDGIGQALLIVDRTGRTIHRTAALDCLLEEDPERERILYEMHRLAQPLSLILVSGGARGAGTGASGEVSTDLARYRLQGSHVPAALLGTRDAVLVSLERLTPRAPSDGSLRERFGLTRAEARVARLLAEGKANRAVAAELSISPHTAERHTEKVLLKMRVHSRAEVGPRMLRG